MSNEYKGQSGKCCFFVKRCLKFAFVITPIIFCLALFVPGPTQKSSYMGAEYCASCHQEEYKIFMSSAHHKASASLPEDKKDKESCLSCHATGFTNLKEPYFSGVQCESCHGPGKHYAPLHIKKDVKLSKLMFMERPASNTCIKCHDQGKNSKWFLKAMNKIKHWPEKGPHRDLPKESSLEVNKRNVHQIGSGAASESVAHSN